MVLYLEKVYLKGEIVLNGDQANVAPVVSRDKALNVATNNFWIVLREKKSKILTAQNKQHE